MIEASRRAMVGVLTYKRPDDLRELLPLLETQAAAAEGLIDWSVSVLIVDNDASRSAEGVVAEHAPPLFRYVCEPTPGIVAARNRALAEATEADVLVYIDDDERPEPGWLSHLLSVHQETGAAAVAGAMVPAYQVPPDAWIAEGRFFVRPRHATGTPVPAAGAGNLLLHIPTISRLGLRFDPAFGTIGGEDTLFTRSLVAAGETLVWCDEAVALDCVPAARMSRKWVLRRAFRSGNSSALVAFQLASPDHALAIRIRVVMDGVLRVVGGVIKWFYGRLTGSKRHQARGLRTSARGMGMIAAVAGHALEEYRRA